MYEAKPEPQATSQTNSGTGIRATIAVCESCEPLFLGFVPDREPMAFGAFEILATKPFGLGSGAIVPFFFRFLDFFFAFRAFCQFSFSFF
jgi:hypothetical protein